MPEDKTDHAFAGDAVLMNDRLAVVFRRGGPGAEVYGLGQEGFTLRAVLAPAADTPGRSWPRWPSPRTRPPTWRWTPRSSPPAATPPDACVTTLAAGQVYVKTEARAGAKALAVEAPSRFVVLPDFFADDIVVDAAEIPVATAELPSENFLVHLLPDRNAIVMTVAEAATRTPASRFPARARSG